MVTRRGVFLAVGSGLQLASLLPSRLHAQQRPKVIGVLNPGTIGPFEPYRGIFIRAMHDFGYVIGTHFTLVERFADGRNERLRELAAELATLRVDIIITNSTNGALAAMQASSSIPIVFLGVADPVLAGLADTIARPGRNLTGLANFATDLSAKRLQLLQQMVPNLARVAVLANPTNPYFATQLQRMQPSASQLGLRLLLFSAGTRAELEPAFKAMTQQRAEAVIITADTYLFTENQRIAELALTSRLPSMFAFASGVEAGGTMSYGNDPKLEMRQLAVYVDKIFKGAMPGELPIEQPTRIDLVINRKTAKALQLTIPQLLLLQAENVID